MDKTSTTKQFVVITQMWVFMSLYALRKSQTTQIIVNCCLCMFFENTHKCGCTNARTNQVTHIKLNYVQTVTFFVMKTWTWVSVHWKRENLIHERPVSSLKTRKHVSPFHKSHSNRFKIRVLQIHWLHNMDNIDNIAQRHCIVVMCPLRRLLLCCCLLFIAHIYTAWRVREVNDHDR